MKTRKYLLGQSIRPTVDLSLLAPNLKKLERDATILNYLINQGAEERHLLQLLDKLNTSEIPIVFNSSGEHMDVLPRTIGLKSVSPEFAAFSLGAGLANGAAQRTFPYVLKGIQTLFKGVTPSTYLGSGYYNTVLGGNNVSLPGALADAGLLSYWGVNAGKEFINDPSIFNGTNTALAVIPGMPMVSGSAKIKALKLFDLIKALKHMNRGKEAKELATTGLKDVLDGKNINFLVSHIDDFYITRSENYRTLLEIFNKVGLKYMKGSNDAIKAANELDTAKDPAKVVDRIRKEIAHKLKQKGMSLEQDGISWDDLVIMPSRARVNKDGKPFLVDIDNFNKFLVSPVGKDSETPFLKRYYDNVMEKILGENGLLKKLITEGKLKRNEQGLWVGLNEKGEYVRVEPQEYIKSQLPAFLKLHLRLPEYKTGVFNYPVHGTRDTDIRYLTRPSEVPGHIGIMTVIENDRPGAALMINRYRGSGYSFPFYPAKEEWEIPIRYRKGTINNSNSVGGSGKNAPTVTNENPSNATRIEHLSDPFTTGLPIDEYNFGRDFLNLKSKYNTLDFEEGAGPFAFNYNNTKNNIISFA